MAKKKDQPARKPTRKPGIERYQRIIEAAERLILERGSGEGLTLDAVAKKAGVPRVSLYYFFESVGALIDTLNHRTVKRMAAELPRPPVTMDWRQLIGFYADSVRKFYMNNRL